MSNQNNDIQDFLNDKSVKESLAKGASPDKLNYKSLFGWFFAGILTVVVFIYIAMTLYNYFSFHQGQKSAASAVFYELEDLRAKHNEELTTFGVIDDSSGVYRVPVDSAITLILEDYAN
ncbi:MAG TPA: hypothetical protein DCE78_04880 [Bacteroidetes bacterium]|nr:hypothetical protein [Bacteroidota bacterium]